MLGEGKQQSQLESVNPGNLTRRTMHCLMHAHAGDQQLPVLISHMTTSYLQVEGLSLARVSNTLLLLLLLLPSSAIRVALQATGVLEQLHVRATVIHAAPCHSKRSSCCSAGPHPSCANRLPGCCCHMSTMQQQRCSNTQSGWCATCGRSCCCCAALCMHLADRAAVGDACDVQVLGPLLLDMCRGEG
jgi:hypothetical protein